MADMLDLDKVLGSEISITWNGKEYAIKTDLPVGRVLAILKESAAVEKIGAEDPEKVFEQMEKTFDLIEELFKMSGHTDVTREYIMKNMNWKQGAQLLRNVRRAVIEVDEATQASP